MKCITNLAFSNDKKNRTRSILIIITILLSTMLVTTIMIFCYGSIKFNHQNAGQQYGSFYGTYTKVTEAQIHEMHLRSEFTDIGLMADAGTVKSDKDCSLYWADPTVFEMSNMNQNLIQGAFPKQSNEITAQKSFFELFGYKDPKLGDKVELLCRADNSSKFNMHTFVISGILKDSSNGIEQSGYKISVSKNYYESQVSKEKRKYTAFFRLNKTVSITSDNAEEVMKGLAEKCQIPEKQVYANTYYLIWALDPGKDIIIGGSIIAACILLFTIIVIYNIFQVGITQKIQEYGKIKAIGATRKQLRGIVMREGMLLALIGIPAGLISGCIMAKLSFGWMMKQSEVIRQGTGTLKISILSVPLLLAVAMISFLTVWLALRKPMKIVAKISSIEAIRYLETASKVKHGRKGYSSMGVKEMIFASLSANKKRTVMTISTMGLSCVLFVIVANFVGNMDDSFEARRSVEYGQFEISLDYSLDDKAYPENNLDSILKDNPLEKDMINRIKEIDGVTDVKTRNIMAMKVGGKLNSVIILDKKGFEHFKESGAGKGNLNYDAAKKNDSIIYGWVHFLESEGYSLNQNVNTVFLGREKKSEYKGNIQGAFGCCDADWAITEETCNKLGLDSGIDSIWVNCDKKSITEVKKKLEEIINGKKYIGMETYQDAFKNAKILSRFLKLACYTVLAIVGVIGFMNMANTMIISIITRKREFGMLQAIGMTNRQLNFMLQMEGIIFTLGTVLVAAAIGVPGGYGFFKFCRTNGVTGLYIYHFPWAEVLIMILILSILQIILSFILSRNVRNESLVERIRYQE